jgi:OOP family OmpA-OmpF porin
VSRSLEITIQEIIMSKGFQRIAALSLFALFAWGCAQTLPSKEPLAVAPVQFGERELREVSNLFVLTDASGSMWKDETFPTAKALSASFVKTLPDASARSKSGTYNVGYIAFGGDDRVEVPLQRFDRQKLMAAANKADIMGSMSGTGGTTPFHAVIDEVAQQLEGQSGATALVLFSDGVADDSERALASAAALAEGYRGGRLCIYGVQVGEQQAGAEFLRALSGVTACGNSQSAQQLSNPASFQRYAKNVVVGAAPLPPVAAAPPSACAGAIRLRGIEFGFDKAEVTDASKVVLDTAIETIASCKELRVKVDGHTDSIGTEAYNEGLSERRARAVRDYLVSKGVGEGRLTARGLGEMQPIASNDTSDGRARNRRVELAPIQ